MKLSQWIAVNGGRESVARQLGVTRQALHYWLCGKVIPRPATMRRIVKLSRGRVSFYEIISVNPPKKRVTRKKARS